MHFIWLCVLQFVVIRYSVIGVKRPLLFDCLYVRMSVYSSVCLASVFLFVCLYVRMFVRSSVHLFSVRLFVSVGLNRDMLILHFFNTMLISLFPPPSYAICEQPYAFKMPTALGALNLFIWLHNNLSISLPINNSYIYLLIFQSIFLSIIFNNRFIYLSIFINRFIYLSIFIYIYLPVYLTMYLSIPTPQANF